jgi:hypothetical protein
MDRGDLLWIAGLTGLFGLIAALRATGPCLNYDSANYHLSLVRWRSEYPLVPGLGNLHPIFGLNLGSLLFPALLENIVGQGRSSHFVGGALLVLAWVTVLEHIVPLFRDPGSLTATNGAAVVWSYPVVFHLVGHRGSALTSLGTDLPVVLVAFAATSVFLEAWEGMKTKDLATGSMHLTVALSLVALLPVLKASSGVFSLATWFVWAWLGLRACNCSYEGRRAVLVAAVISAGLVLPWVIGNVTLTGYPFFPLSWAALPVDWRVPREYIDGLLWWTRAYARTPGDFSRMLDQFGIAWVGYWLRVEGRPALNEGIVPISVSALVISLGLLRRDGRSSRTSEATLLLGTVLPAGIALVSWFLTAPLFRYGEFLFWSLCSGVTAGVLAMNRTCFSRHMVRLLLVVFVVLPIVFWAYYTTKAQGFQSPVATLAAEWVMIPGPDHGFYPPFNPVLTTVRLDGVMVSMPVVQPYERTLGEWRETLIWDAALPATPRLDPQLRLRRHGTLHGGFWIDASARTWVERHAAEIAAVRFASGWGVGRLAVYFTVRPELVVAGLNVVGVGHRGFEPLRAQ